MVTIQAHRNAIGSYYDKDHLLPSYGQGNSNSLLRHTNCKNRVINMKDFVKLFVYLSLRWYLDFFVLGL